MMSWAVSLKDRFWLKVEKGSGCWLWRGTRFVNGYGMIKKLGKRCKAHRISWELHNGPIPDGMYVCHRCDVRHCVNPDHLFLGTNDDNMADMKAKGRAARGERSGLAKLGVDDVRMIRMRHANGEAQAAIATDYGVVQQLVSRICRREIWTHI